MSKRYISPHNKNELESLQHYRDYCEQKAMATLNWYRHLFGRWVVDNETQKKRDYFLYKYYEYQFDLTDRAINNICAYGKH